MKRTLKWLLIAALIGLVAGSLLAWLLPEPKPIDPFGFVFTPPK